MKFYALTIFGIPEEANTLKKVAEWILQNTEKGEEMTVENHCDDLVPGDLVNNSRG